MHYCIVGNGMAATSAVESLREVDREGRITVISDEVHPFYSRPLISYLLAGEVTEDRLWLRPADFYERLSLETAFGRRVERVDADSRRLHFDNGSAVAYDRLLLACGGRPITPPIEGSDRAGVFTFTTLDETRRLDAYMRDRSPRRATVLGAGLIGLKTAEALIARGMEVTLVELADRVLSATLDERASDLIREGLASVGAEVLTESTIASIEGTGKGVTKVVLRDGGSFPSDLVVLAIGVRPAIEPVEGSGIECARGVLVDEYLQTSVEGVFAAGDVVEGYDITLDTSRVVATWVNAARQGRVAGRNLAGAQEEFEGSLAMNAVEIAGVATISMGVTSPAPDELDGVEVLEDFDPKEATYRKVVLRANRVIGGIFVGEIDRAGIFTGLIRSGTDVSTFRDRLLSPDFGLVWLPKEYRKHAVTGPGIEV